MQSISKKSVGYALIDIVKQVEVDMFVGDADLPGYIVEKVDKMEGLVYDRDLV